MQFSGKFGQIIGWCPLENLGYAAVVIIVLVICRHSFKDTGMLLSLKSCWTIRNTAANLMWPR